MYECARLVNNVEVEGRSGSLILIRRSGIEKFRKREAGCRPQVWILSMTLQLEPRRRWRHRHFRLSESIQPAQLPTPLLHLLQIIVLYHCLYYVDTLFIEFPKTSTGKCWNMPTPNDGSTSWKQHNHILKKSTIFSSVEENHSKEIGSSQLLEGY